MAIGSSIEWTEATWNPVAGCTIVSPGCTNCYAMRMASRLEKMGQSKYANLTRKSGGRPKWNGNVTLDAENLAVPIRWKTGRMIFVNSMSDLFQANVPFEFVDKVVKVIQQTPQHTYQILTKRPEILAEYSLSRKWPVNAWLGVSVENDDYTHRADVLKTVDCAVKFLSLEPLLGPVSSLDYHGIDWAIVGGESGPGSRPVEYQWIADIRDRCVKAGVAFHFKQWGGTNKKKSGRVLDGRTWDEFPDKIAA